MKVVVSLTTTPPRLNYVGVALTRLLDQKCDEVWLNIPPSYNRFPEWNGSIPDFSNFGSKLKVNRDCEDLGPGTKFLGSAPHLDPSDLIIWVDDDTCYDDNLVENLVKLHHEDPTSAWGLSGFSFDTYFNKIYPRRHDAPYDVLEGYGSVMAKVEWVQKIIPEFKELLDVTWNDDMIISNLFEKYEIKRKTAFLPECNLGQVRQFMYGFGDDALHKVAGEGGHQDNNLKILKELRLKNKLYFKYTEC
jgi:hypothetical protein